MSNEFSTAMTNRSLRTIKNELEFLADSSVITQQQLSTILSQLPDQGRNQSRVSSPPNEAPTNRMNNLSLTNSNTSAYNEKAHQGYYSQPEPQPSPAAQPPPAYPVAPAPPTALTTATALYTYSPTDAGDLALAPNDRIQVTEYMNAEWWKGRSERTGQEGIFPRSYVRPEDKIPPTPAPTNYGNVPHEVSQGGGSSMQQGGEGQSKTSEYGKKFGKKMGNAAIFGAGATMGSKIVNGIF